MAKTRKNALIEGAFNQFDVVVKRFLDTVPERLQTAEIEPPGGKKPEIRPLPAQNPFRSI